MESVHVVLRKYAPLIYLFTALPVVLFQVFFTPPFQTPDAPNNFFRVYQISNGTLIGSRRGNSSGGQVNDAMIKTAQLFNYIPFHYDHKISASVMTRAAKYAWRTGGGRGHYVFASFPNTSVYPPLAYVPQVIGTLIGRSMNLSILATYRLDLLLVSLCALTLTFLALRVDSTLTPVIYVCATLPMVTCLYAAMEPDALLISVGLLLAALLEKHAHNETGRAKWWPLYLAVFIMFLAIQKPPYIALLALLFLPSLVVSASYALMRRVLFAIIPLGMTCAWVIYAKMTAWVTINPAGSALGSHFSFVATHPVAFLHIVWNSINGGAKGYIMQLIGVLGWLDARFSPGYYVLALTALAMAALLYILSAHPMRKADWCLLFIAISGSALMIFFSLYSTWSPVRPESIAGVQGRYFLPILPLSFMLLYPLKRNARSMAVKMSAKYAIATKYAQSGIYVFLYLLFPLISTVATVSLIMHRYYL